MLLYADFKQMLTRRLPDNGTAAFLPLPFNTLWLDAQNPLEPLSYPDATREVSAAALLLQLDELSEQQAVYLNAVPLVRPAGEAAVAEKLATAGASWHGVHNIAADTPAPERARRYIEQCGKTGFGIYDDPLKDMVELSQESV